MKNNPYDSAGKYKRLTERYRLATIEALVNLRGRPIDFLTGDEYLELPPLARVMIDSAETSRQEARSALLSAAQDDEGIESGVMEILDPKPSDRTDHGRA